MLKSNTDYLAKQFYYDKICKRLWCRTVYQSAYRTGIYIVLNNSSKLEANMPK